MAGRSRSRWLLLWRNQAAMGGLVLLIVIATGAALAPWWPLADPDATALESRLLPPLADGHWLGTDQLGRDILSRMLHGTRLSLSVAMFGTGVAALLGTVIGLLAAYYGRLVDTLLMRGIDVLMAFPYLLLALAIVAVLGPGLGNAAIAIAIVNVPFFARTVRGTAASVRSEDFIDAARLSGRSEAGIIFGELLPNVAPVILIAMTTTLGWMILETAGLSFLGLGAQPPTADLGGMLGQGRHLAAIAPHVTLIPGVVIFVLAMSLNLLGDGLRDVLDPRASLAQARARSRRPASAGTGRRDHELLTVESLTVAFGDKRVVENVSFSVDERERIGIVGESGSGKSATVQSVLGLLGPGGQVTDGRIDYRGRNLRDDDALRAVRGREIGFVPQNPFASLHPAYTVGRQLTETLRMHAAGGGVHVAERAAELLADVQIPAPRQKLASYPHELSGGMRQRVVIAIAIAARPKLLIADEPTTALDVTVQAEVLELLAGLCEERGMGLLFISHDLAVVSQICSRVLVFRHGRLIESAGLDEVLRAPREVYTRQLIASVPRLGERQRLLAASGRPA